MFDSKKHRALIKINWANIYFTTTWWLQEQNLGEIIIANIALYEYEYCFLSHMNRELNSVKQKTLNKLESTHKNN